MRSHSIEFGVGLFILVAIAGLVFMAFKVSGLTSLNEGSHYTVVAYFDNIGDLKARAPVTVSGVKVGNVSAIALDPNSFRARVTLKIDDRYQALPVDTSASIFTQGLLGANYVSLTPGFEEQLIQPDGQIQTTHSALILENLIGQLVYNLSGDKKKNK